MTEKRSTADAHLRILQAEQDRLKVRDESSPFIKRSCLMAADCKEEVAREELALAEIPERGMGGELVPSFEHGVPGVTLALKDPDHVNLNASVARVRLADECGAFDMALDTAETIGAQNATEQMLAHQMAATHKTAMELLHYSGNQVRVENQIKFINAAARLMDVYQKGMLTLSRVRTGGKQVITVQQVQVKDGGQAIINGGSMPEGRGLKNDTPHA
jgi:hypothetical protein